MRLFKSFNKFRKNIAIIDKEYSNLTYEQVLIETNKIIIIFIYYLLL